MNTVNYTFDDNGNLLSDGVNTYTYDSANRLIEVNSNTTYTYNGLGDRLSQTVDSVTTNYTLNLNTGLTQVLDDGTNTYTYGLGRISQHNTDTLVTDYFLGDALGSVRQLIDSTGEIILAKGYDPYGTVTQSAGNGQSMYAYTGEQMDVSGLTYLRARYYNPVDARFMSRDTWAGDVNNPLSLNKWNYVEGNPVNYTDPSGHCIGGSSIALFTPLNCVSSSGQPSTSISLAIQLLTLMRTCNQSLTLPLPSTPVTIVGFPNIKIDNPKDWSAAEIAELTYVLKDIVFPVFRNSLSAFIKAFGNINIRVVPDYSIGGSGSNKYANAPFDKINFEHRIFDGTHRFGIIHEFGHQFDWQEHESDAEKLHWRSQQFVDDPTINMSGCTGNRLQCRNTYTDKDHQQGQAIYPPSEAYANAFAAFILAPCQYCNVQAEKLSIIQNDIQGVPRR